MLEDPQWKVPRKPAIPKCGTLHRPGKQHVASNANAVTLELRRDSRRAAGAKAPGTGTKCHWLEEGQQVPPEGFTHITQEARVDILFSERFFVLWKVCQDIR